ncbi:MAG: hypothetical protein C0409_11340, partial [Novosphingobium sp.]|nr:hypothetical protein [Novosphingobium sp.]
RLTGDCPLVATTSFASPQAWAKAGTMKTTLEFVVALTTGILFSGAIIGAAILGVGAVCGGSCYWLWRRFGRRK